MFKYDENNFCKLLQKVQAENLIEKMYIFISSDSGHSQTSKYRFYDKSHPYSKLKLEIVVVLLANPRVVTSVHM
mgnify:CR=1 FL=1